MRSVRINHQKTQAVLGNIHRNRLNRKITEIHHKRLLRMRTQRRRLIQTTRLRASHLILSRNTHLSQTRTQRITISWGSIRLRAILTHRTRKLQQRQRRRTLQSRRRRQTATHRNTRINQQVSAKLIGQHNIPAALLVHCPRNTRHIGEPALQMTRLNITNHNRALIAGHLQRRSTQHAITTQRTRHIGAVRQRHRQARATQKINVLAQKIQTPRCRPHTIRLITIRSNKLLTNAGNLRAMVRKSRPLGGSGHRHGTPLIKPNRALKHKRHPSRTRYTPGTSTCHI